MLVASGADVHATNKRGRTALHHAVQCHNNPFTNYDIIKFLVSKEADLNAKGDDGITPLLLAMSPHSSVYKNSDIIKFFVSKGSDVNVQGYHGGTPLHYVACWPSHCYSMPGYVETAEFLISKGADVNAKDWEGKTPLDRAEERGNSVMAEYISKHVFKVPHQ